MQDTNLQSNVDSVSLLIWIAIGLAICVVAVLIWWTLRSARRAALARDAKPEPETAPQPAALFRKTGLEVSFARGLQFLRERTAGRDYRYGVPWVLVLGASNSGATTVLANAGAASPLDREGGPNLGQPGGLEWWFYQRGVALNPPSEMVLRADGRSSDEIGFDMLLSRLIRKGPRRPLDGLVLAISAEDLLDASRRAEIIGRASVIRHKLGLIRKRLSMRLPVYVLVTKCDEVLGFASFAAELRQAHQNMFGWSNPYPFDAAFSPAWIDQGFAEMQARIAEQQMDIFVTSSVQDPDGVFLFPGEFQALCDPLRAYLTQAFQDNAYEESYFFRGFYFTGDATVARPTVLPRSTELALAADAAGGSVAVVARPETLVAEPEDTVGDRRPVFLHDLFAVKIFPESQLARPLSRVDMSRNRTVMTARILTALFILVALVGSMAGSLRLYGLKHGRLSPLFQTLINDMQAAGRPGLGVSTESRNLRKQSVTEAAANVLGSMGLLSGRRFQSVFIPASWSGRVDDEIQAGLAIAFQSIVLEAFRIELDQRLVGQHGILQSTAVPAVGALQQDQTYDTPASVPYYQAWTRFVGDLKTLEENIGRYNRICAPGRGEISDFRELVKYLGMAADLPEGFDFDNPYFKRILSSARNPQFDYSGRKTAEQHATDLLTGFFETWYGKNNRVESDISTMVQRIDRFSQRSAGATYQELKDLAENITETSEDLQSAPFEWVSRDEFPKESFDIFTRPVQGLVFLDRLNVEDLVDNGGGSAFKRFKDSLRGQSTRLTGRVLDMDLTPVDVSSSVATLRENLTYLLGQPFVVREPGPPMRLTQSRYLWDRASLLEAKKLFDAYDRFERGSLRSMPSYMANVLRSVALERLQQNALDLVGQAQGSVPPSTSTDSDRELQSFAQSGDLLEQLLESFAKLPDPTWARGLSTLLQAQCFRLLAGLDAELSESNPYAVRSSSFDWWEGEKPLSLAAYEVRSGDDLKEYLNQQREAIQAIARRADPLLKFLEPKSTGQGAQALAGWHAINSELKRYSEKRPGNSVALLEDFIQTGLDKIAPDNACQDPARDTANRADLFLARRGALRSQALSRCRVLSQRAYVNQLAEPFNSRLAGRFPFAGADPRGGAPEADPAALAEFLTRFDQYGKIAGETLRQSPQFGETRDAALGFLSRVAQIRPVFAAFLAGIEKDPVPSFDFAVTFRVNPVRAIDANQIAEWGLDVGQESFRYRGKETSGHWRLGDPIRLSLRFADDSPMLPAADPAQPDMAVSRRMVSFEYTDAWSLIHLLLAHKPNRGELDVDSQRPHLLSFYVPTIPDRSLPQPKDAPVSGMVRVYVQITVLPPGAKEGVSVPLPFPDAAPVLVQKTVPN